VSPEEERLRELRKEIDKQDQALLEILARRFSLVSTIAELKKEQGIPLRDLEREREILEDRTARGEAFGIDASVVVQVFQLVLGHSVRLQRRLVLRWEGLRRSSGSLTSPPAPEKSPTGPAV
jgi:chorismate mutase